MNGEIIYRIFKNDYMNIPLEIQKITLSITSKNILKNFLHKRGILITERVFISEGIEQRLKATKERRINEKEKGRTY